jgi:hypothetical protein
MKKGAFKHPGIAGSVIIAVVLGGTLWGVTSRSRAQRSDLPEELRQALEKESDPGKVFEEARRAMDREDLTPEQRRAIWASLRDRMEQEMDRRMDEYFTAATPEARDAVLDRHITEFQARMKEMERHRAERERTAGPQSGPAQASGPSSDGERRGPGPNGQPPSREQRKRWSESRDPDRAARRMAYFTAMRQRAEKRGIQLPWPGRGPGPGR